MPLRPLAAVLLCAFVAITDARSGSAQSADAGRAPASAKSLRIVSLNPSLTATLVALGAGAQLVGIDDYSAHQQSALRELPAVGGLFNPSLEAILALAPDLVVLVPSAQQRDLRARLEALGIGVLELPNITLAELLASIETLGARLGREQAARERVEAIRDAWRATSAASAQRPRVRAVLVLQREPLYLVGSGSFIDAMLVAAGAENLANVFAESYPRASLEWLIAAAPELILDATENAGSPRDYWARWPSLAAVAGARVLEIPASEVTLPGPHPERALALLAEAVHPGLEVPVATPTPSQTRSTSAAREPSDRSDP